MRKPEEPGEIMSDTPPASRAPTPTKAAEWAVPKYGELVERTGDLGLRLRQIVRRRLEEARAHWKAAARGLPRSAGHRQGVEALRQAVRTAADLGIEYLTIYSFSSENWSRPAAEVSFLLDLLRRFIRTDVAELHRAGVRITVIGERARLDPAIVALLEDAERLTRENTALRLVVAFNYGSRQEITRAARAVAQKVAEEIGRAHV